MRPFDYLLLLAAVVLGLALSDLAISTQRLLNAGQRVRWDIFSPLAAVVATLKIVAQWWAWFQGEQLSAHLTFEMFVGILFSAGLLFLLAATALPDEVPGEGIDLARYYASTRRRFWSLFALHLVASNAVLAWVQIRLVGAHFSLAPPLVLALPLAVVLAWFPARWLHGIGLMGFIALYVVQDFGRTLAE